MQKWEYLVVKTHNDQWQDSQGRQGKMDQLKFTNNNRNLGLLLEALGAEGWELVVGHGPGFHMGELIFKRQAT